MSPRGRIMETLEASGGMGIIMALLMNVGFHQFGVETSELMMLGHFLSAAIPTALFVRFDVAK